MKLSWEEWLHSVNDTYFLPLYTSAVNKTGRGAAEEDIFLAFVGQWQTCGNYFKSKQTPRKLPSLLSFVASSSRAAPGFFMFTQCVCVCTTPHLMCSVYTRVPAWSRFHTVHSHYHVSQLSTGLRVRSLFPCPLTVLLTADTQVVATQLCGSHMVVRLSSNFFYFWFFFFLSGRSNKCVSGRECDSIYQGVTSSGADKETYVYHGGTAIWCYVPVSKTSRGVFFILSQSDTRKTFPVWLASMLYPERVIHLHDLPWWYMRCTLGGESAWKCKT